jgi:FG-GAP repeat
MCTHRIPTHWFILLLAVAALGLARAPAAHARHAPGWEFRAWPEVHGVQLLLLADAADAQSPLLSDPFMQRAKLTASEGVTRDDLGTSGAISDGAVIIAMAGASLRPDINQGEVYVFPGTRALLQSFHLEFGLEKSLDVKLQNARAASNALDLATACGLVDAFLHEVQAYAGKQISSEVAFQLLIAADELEGALGCP